MQLSLIHPRLTYLPSQQPLGLGYIAANLEKSGHAVHFVEAAFYNDDDLVIDEIIRKGSKVVGISIMISYYGKAFALARQIKQRIPDIIVVVGGPHPSVVPEAFYNEEFIDYVLAGEGEYSFPNLIHALEAQGKEREILLTQVPGLWQRGGIPSTSNIQRITNLDSLPWPARHLMPMDKYKHRDFNVSFGMHGGNFNIITSRGCPNVCNFCDHTVFGYKPTLRSLSDVVNEIEHVAKTYNIRNFDIMDDTFTLSSERVMEFCEKLLERTMNLFWCCRLRVTGVTRDMLAMMSRAGCIRFSVGIESIDPRVLKATNKKICVEEVVRTLKYAKEFGMLTIGNFMIGNLGDDKESVLTTLQFALNTPEIDLPSYVVLVPLPGTPVFSIAQKNGWIRSFNWDEYRMNSRDLPLMRNEALSHEDVRDLYSLAAKAVRPKIQQAFEKLHKPRIALYDKKQLG